jgi:hypothetical protein
VTAATKRHLTRIHTLPCVVCKNCYGKHRPAEEAHHIEAYRGAHSDWATVPLCKECHTHLHQQRRRPFYLAHNIDDVKLLAWTIQLLEAKYAAPPR